MTSRTHRWSALDVGVIPGLEERLIGRIHDDDVRGTMLSRRAVKTRLETPSFSSGLGST